MIQFVLLGTTHSGNIGAAARAMKTMGVTQMALVKPKEFPNAEAISRASGADDLLMNAKVCDTMEQAISDSKLVIGTTARKRHVNIPVIDGEQAAKLLVTEAQSHPVSLVFGKERYGMTNDEVQHCHYLVRLPTVEDFSSLNLAAAIQVLAYECRKAELDLADSSDSGSPDANFNEDIVSAEAMESFYQHYFKVMEEALYLRKEGHESIKHKIRLMYNRIRPQKHEIDILRGFLTKVERKIK